MELSAAFQDDANNDAYIDNTKNGKAIFITLQKKKETDRWFLCGQPS